jgi:predicted RNA polymerase sigma factor
MAATPEETDWRRIAGLYAVLAQRFPSPIVKLNRAVAVAMVYGPGPGLELLEAVAGAGALSDYHLLHAVRGDLLVRLGRHHEAATSFLQAAELTANVAEQHFLRDRAGACVRHRDKAGSAQMTSVRIENLIDGPGRTGQPAVEPRTSGS